MQTDVLESATTRPVVMLADVRASREAERRREAGDRTIAAHWYVYQARGFLLSKAPKSRDQYTCIMRRAVDELPEEPTTGQVEAWVNGLHTEGGLSQAYARQHLEVLKAITTAASRVTNDHALADAVRIASCQWKPKPPRARCPPRDLMARVLPLARNRAEECWLRLAGYGGLRVGEIRGVELRDWDRRAHTLSIERQLDNDCRKNKSVHVVTLSGAAESAFMWAVSHRDDVRPSRGPAKRRTDGRVFPWGKSYVDSFMARLRTGLGDDAAFYFPPRDAWHVFRHWGASELAHRGASVIDIMAFLGDASPHVALAYIDTVRGTTRGRCMDVLERVSREAAQLALRSSPAHQTEGIHQCSEALQPMGAGFNPNIQA